MTDPVLEGMKMRYKVMAGVLSGLVVFGLGLWLVCGCITKTFDMLVAYKQELDDSTQASLVATKRLERVLGKVDGLERALTQGGYSLRVVPSGSGDPSPF